ASSKLWTFRTICDVTLINAVDTVGAFHIQFNPQAFGEDYGVAAANPEVAPREVNTGALSHAKARGVGGSDLPTFLVPNGMVEINVYANSGSRMSVPRAPTTLTIYYPDANNDGY